LDTKTDVWVIKFSEAGKLRADIALFTDTTRNIVGFVCRFAGLPHFRIELFSQQTSMMPMVWPLEA
jgi:hypothetical protein